jgi:hypothetical protein
MPKAVVHDGLLLGLNEVTVPREDQQVVEAAHAAECAKNVAEGRGVIRVQFAPTPFCPRQPALLTVLSQQRDDLVEAQFELSQVFIKIAVGHGRSLGRGALTFGKRAPAAADIPCSEKSSGGVRVVAPGSVFVVGGAGLQTAVQDADEAVCELPQGGLVADVAAAQRLVVRGGAG